MQNRASKNEKKKVQKASPSPSQAVAGSASSGGGGMFKSRRTKIPNGQELGDRAASWNPSPRSYNKSVISTTTRLVDQSPTTAKTPRSFFIEADVATLDVDASPRTSGTPIKITLQHPQEEVPPPRAKKMIGRSPRSLALAQRPPTPDVLEHDQNPFVSHGLSNDDSMLNGGEGSTVSGVTNPTFGDGNNNNSRGRKKTNLLVQVPSSVQDAFDVNSPIFSAGDPFAKSFSPTPTFGSPKSLNYPSLNQQQLAGQQLSDDFSDPFFPHDDDDNAMDQQEAREMFGSPPPPPPHPDPIDLVDTVLMECSSSS